MRSKLWSLTLLATLGATPALPGFASAADRNGDFGRQEERQKPDEHQRQDERRVYDADHKDYHNWNADEDRRYREFLAERHQTYRDYFHAGKQQQRDYWRWRHDHEDRR